jgi:hypothetical protein
MPDPGYTCLTRVDPLVIVIELAADGLWTMKLFDGPGGAAVIMPPSEYDLPAAKEKALINAAYYMRKFASNREWSVPGSVDWAEFAPRSVVWET